MLSKPNSVPMNFGFAWLRGNICSLMPAPEHSLFEERFSSSSGNPLDARALGSRLAEAGFWGRTELPGLMYRVRDTN